MPVEQVNIIMIMIKKMMMVVAKIKMIKMVMMVTGVWEDNDPSLSVRCAEGRPRVEVTQVGEIFSKWVKVWPFG